MQPTMTLRPCQECRKPSKVETHWFPSRPGEWGHPFYKLLYFNDPFFGGDNAEFCSSECLNAHNQKRKVEL